jgi:hypothetical protein
VAVHGTKIAAAATRHATRSYEQIANGILEEAAHIGAAEDALFDDERGHEVGRGAHEPDRRTVPREAKRALEAERAAPAKRVPRDRGRAADRSQVCSGRRRLGVRTRGSASVGVVSSGR